MAGSPPATGRAQRSHEDVVLQPGCSLDKMTSDSLAPIPRPVRATLDDLRGPVGRPHSHAAVSQINSHELKCNSPSVRCHIAAPRRGAPDCRRLSIRNQSRGSAHTRWKIAAGNASGQHIDRICLSPIQAIRTFAKGQGESELRKSWSRGPVVQGNDCDHPCDDRDIRPFPPHGSERPT